MTQFFKVGDVVIVRGNPYTRMTVEAQDGQNVSVAYFVGDTLVRATHHASKLERSFTP